MTMKEKLEIHRQIEAENERKLKEWKELVELLHKYGGSGVPDYDISFA